MSAGQQNIRKAIGAIKDSTTVGLAKVNSDHKAIDVAIIKATSHDEALSKEKYIRTILQALSSSRPRADVAYCLQSLAKRLAKTRNWAVALKTLIILHRATRDIDPSIRKELVRCTKIKNYMLNLSHFKDDSSRNGISSSLIPSDPRKSYAVYLEERLECLRVLKYDIQNDCKKIKQLDTSQLFNDVPHLQLLLFRLVCCRPQGAAQSNCLIQHALSIVAAESVRLYVAITDGVQKLIDKFFEMQRYEARWALDIYRKSADQAQWLSEFFDICRSLEFGQGQKYIKIQKPPKSLIITMEKYVKEAPPRVAPPWTTNRDINGANPKQVATHSSNLERDHKKDIGSEEKSDKALTAIEGPGNKNSKVVTATPSVDLWAFDDSTQEASQPHDQNTLSNAIATPDNLPSSSCSSTLASQPDSWELELFTATSSNEEATAQWKVAGELDRLRLDRLSSSAVRNTNQNTGTYTWKVGLNPFETMDHNQDLFLAPRNMAPQHQQEALTGHGATNPFGNPFVDDASPTHNRGISLFPAQGPHGSSFPG